MIGKINQQVLQNFMASTPAQLYAVPVVESGEAIIPIQGNVADYVICRAVLRETNDILGTELMFARLSVVERLQKASEIFFEMAGGCEDLFPRGSRLLVGYAYRLPEVQRSYFERAQQHVRKVMPDLTDESRINEIAFKYVNIPELAGHPAGAAIDVTVVDASGNEVQMGTKFLSFDDKENLAVNSFINKDPTLHSRRMLLREAMLRVEFAPHNGEWWHFSYGDREWAAFYGQTQAMYGEISREYVEKLLPSPLTAARI